MSHGRLFLRVPACCLSNLDEDKIDGYILSRKAKVCIGLELTCPMEENIAQWHRVKQEKYEEIVREAAKHGW